MKTTGFVLTDQIRTVHRAERGFRYVETASDGVLEAVRAIVGELLQIRN